MKLPVRFPCLLLSVLVCVGGVMLHTYNATPEWQAEAKLRVYYPRYTHTPAYPQKEANFGKRVSNEEFLEQVEKMKSAAIMNAVASGLSRDQKRQVVEPYQDGNIFTGPLGEREVFAKCYGVKKQPERRVVRILYTHQNEEIACFMAALFVEEIVRFNREARTSIASPMMELWGVQIKAKNDDIDALHKQRTALIAEMGVVLLQTQINTTTDELGKLAAQMDDVRRHLAEVEARRRQMENPDGSGTPTENGTVPTDIGQEYESAKGKFTGVEASFNEKEKQLGTLNDIRDEWEILNKEIANQERLRDSLQQAYAHEVEICKANSAAYLSIGVMGDAAITTDRPINKNYLERGFIGAAAGIMLGVVLELLMRVFRRNAVKSVGR